MAELFEDRPNRSTNTVGRRLFDSSSNKDNIIMPSSRLDSSNGRQQKEEEVKLVPDKTSDETSMEQLELDLKSILSEISQLGKDRETAWKLSPTRNNKEKSPSPPIPPPRQQHSSPATTPQGKDLPKFCHSCGAAYPERYTVKFCCQCGARRLYI